MYVIDRQTYQQWLLHKVNPTKGNGGDDAGRREGNKMKIMEMPIAKLEENKLSIFAE